MLASGDLIRATPLYVPALILILLGAFTKSAQFPFHFWLPHAMAAPTPVSAYLHSATMVKAGVFLLTRLWPVLAGTDVWILVSSVGLATLVVLGAMDGDFPAGPQGSARLFDDQQSRPDHPAPGTRQPTRRRRRNLPSVNHATFKASLFMAAGIIDHETGTRDLRRLSGLYRYMPITATLAMVAAAAMAGVPLLNGFLSKEMFLSAALVEHSGSLLDQILPVLATLASSFTVLYSLRFIHQTFFGPPPTSLPREPGEAPLWMRVPIEILVFACLLVGIIPAATIGPFLASAVRSVLGPDAPPYSLAVWHGFSPPLLMSTTALVVGSIAYLLFRKVLNQSEGAPLLRHLKSRRLFEWWLAVIVEAARRLERLLGTRRLQPQLRLLVVVALLAGLLPFVGIGYLLGSRQMTLLDPGFGVIWLIGGACAIGAAWKAKYHRLAALILAGGAGLASCISFLWLSAPDLALTQLLVETVTTTLLLLGLRWLPEAAS